MLQAQKGDFAAETLFICGITNNTMILDAAAARIAQTASGARC